VTNDASGGRPPGEPGAPQLRLRSLGPGAAGLLSLLVAACLPVPFLGPFIAPFAAIPVLHLMGAEERPVLLGWFLPLTAACLVTLVSRSLGLTLVVGYVLSVVVPLAGVWAWRRYGWSEGRWAAVTVLSTAMLVIGGVVVASLPETPEAAIKRQLQEPMAQLAEAFEDSGMSDAAISESFEQYEQMMSGYGPMIIVLYLVWVLFVIRPRLPLLGFEMQIGPFESYRSELWLPAGFIVTGLAMFFGSGTLRWVAQNLLAAVGILFFVHGLAIIRAHLARWFGRRWHLRWVAGLLSLLAPAFVAMLGLADSFFDLRPRTEHDRGNPCK
jgi:hypothetical protein